MRSPHPAGHGRHCSGLRLQLAWRSRARSVHWPTAAAIATSEARKGVAFSWHRCAWADKLAVHFANAWQEQSFVQGWVRSRLAVPTDSGSVQIAAI